MGKYVKLFHDTSSADGFRINDIPWIAWENQRERAFVCNKPGNVIKLIDDNLEMILLPPDNEIWYTTTDGNPYPLEQIIAYMVEQMGATYNGPAIISNEYNEDLDMYVMEFEDDVTVVGDVNTDTMNVDGPFFATNSDLGLSCNIETIILPESVTRIGVAAFYGCSGLRSIAIFNNVTYIGAVAFQNCTSLTSVTIPNNVASIGTWAFDGCSSLTSVTIPNSVTSIGDFAFWDCRGGEYIGGCYYLGNDVFVRTWAGDINDIVIREGTKYIEAESIGSYQTISFPSTTKIIGGTAIFRNGGGSEVDLISVTCYAVTPPVINHNSIGHIDDTTVFYVPAQSVNAYKNAPGWSTYADRIYAIQS